MLESGNTLKTWRIDTSPEHIGNDPTPAEKIFDHNLKFLTYQGVVNNGRGSVRIVDEGCFEILEESENSIHLCVQGKFLLGTFLMEHIEQNRWQLVRR